jgi:hypothetical protein
MLCLFLLGTAQAQTREDVVDLVINGDFEDEVLQPWRLSFRPGGGGDAELTFDDEESFTGDFSLKVEINSTSGNGRDVNVWEQPILENIEKGKKYTYSVWMKAEKSRPLTLNTMKSGGGVVTNPVSKEFTLTTEWEEHWFTMDATDSVAFRLEILLGQAEPTVWIDHITFYQGEYVDEKLQEPEVVTKTDDMLSTCWGRLKAVR